ncbi:MAG: PD-(D/E)XK nuclease domain-containing protein [Minicystis sp.]
MREELEVLLAGGTIEEPIEESIALRDLATRSDAIWSFLLFTGYLKAIEVRYVEAEGTAVLAIPNLEVAGEIRKMVRSWFEAQVGDGKQLQRFLAALLRGEARVVERYLSHIAKVNLSYFDAAGPEPERFYHGLVVGLLVGLGSAYEVRSNRESGFGRCDVMILPKAAGQPGVVLELKAVDTEEGETPEKAIAAALKQIRDRDYAAELRERGAAPIHEMAAVFDGKRAYVRVA